MKWIAITGTQHPHPKDRYVVRATLKRFPKNTIFVTGACIGIDAMAAREAKALGYCVHTIVPFDRKKVDPQWRDYCDTFEEMPPKTDYRDRNHRLVWTGKHGLLTFAAYPEDHPASLRSGTWMTVRIARKIYKRKVVKFILRSAFLGEVQ